MYFDGAITVVKLGCKIPLSVVLTGTANDLLQRHTCASTKQVTEQLVSITTFAEDMTKTLSSHQIEISPSDLVLYSYGNKAQRGTIKHSVLAVVNAGNSPSLLLTELFDSVYMAMCNAESISKVERHYIIIATGYADSLSTSSNSTNVNAKNNNLPKTSGGAKKSGPSSSVTFNFLCETVVFNGEVYGSSTSIASTRVVESFPLPTPLDENSDSTTTDSTFKLLDLVEMLVDGTKKSAQTTNFNRDTDSIFEIDRNVGLVENPIASAKAKSNGKRTHYKQLSRGEIDDKYSLTISNDPTEPTFQVITTNWLTGAPDVQSVSKPAKYDIYFLVQYESQKDAKAGPSNTCGEGSLQKMYKTQALNSLKSLLNTEFIQNKAKKDGGLLELDQLMRFSNDKKTRGSEIESFVQAAYEEILEKNTNITSMNAREIEGKMLAELKDNVDGGKIDSMLPSSSSNRGTPGRGAGGGGMVDFRQGWSGGGCGLSPFPFFMPMPFPMQNSFMPPIQPPPPQPDQLAVTAGLQQQLEKVNETMQQLGEAVKFLLKKQQQQTTENDENSNNINE